MLSPPLAEPCLPLFHLAAVVSVATGRGRIQPACDGPHNLLLMTVCGGFIPT